MKNDSSRVGLIKFDLLGKDKSLKNQMILFWILGC